MLYLILFVVGVGLLGALWFFVAARIGLLRQSSPQAPAASEGGEADDAGAGKSPGRPPQKGKPGKK